MSMDSKQPPSSPQVRALGEHFETALDRAARAAEPPDYDQLAAYVDGTLDDVDREIVESWLDSDPALRAEVADLRELHDAMSQPAVSSPGTPSAARPSSSVVSFEEAAKRAGAGRGRRFGTMTVIVGAMAAAVIAATTWLAVRTARKDGGRPDAAGSQVAHQGQTPPPEQSPVQPANPPAGTRPGDTPPGTAGSASASGAPAGTAANAETVAVRDAGGMISIDAAGTVTGLTADGGHAADDAPDCRRADEGRGAAGGGDGWPRRTRIDADGRQPPARFHAPHAAVADRDGRPHRAARLPLVRASWRAQLCRHHLWAGIRSRDGEVPSSPTRPGRLRRP